MSRFNHRRKLAPREIFLRALTILASIVVLGTVMPKDTVNEMTYKKGEPWDDSPLIAKDSFPVFKPDEVLQRERDSLHRFYEPYFQQDPTVRDSMTEALKRDFASLSRKTVPHYYLAHLLRKLSEVYQRGVMETEDYDRLLQEKTAFVRLFWQNEAGAKPLRQVFTEKTAYEYMMEEGDSTRFTHKALGACDLTSKGRRWTTRWCPTWGRCKWGRRLWTEGRLWTTTLTACSSRSNVTRGKGRRAQPSAWHLSQASSCMPH